MDLVRFTNSGTEANMMALAAARCFTGRSKIMPMEGGYHGGTLYFSHGASPVNAPFDCVMGHFNDVEATRKLIAANASELRATRPRPHSRLLTRWSMVLLGKVMRTTPTVALALKMGTAT